jgi:hypothetical protein
MLLQGFHDDCCCLCGSPSKLTREHKIKASELREQFGNDALVVVAIGDSGRTRKIAQSTNSKHLKFDAWLCEACNTSRTQKADREFTLFQKLALEQYAAGNDPGSPFLQYRYKQDSDPYLNVIRYLAKLLSCQMATVKAPIPIRLSRFAIGEIHENCLWLEVKVDPTYDNAIHQLGEHQYAAHGGLVVYGDKQSGVPNAFHSALTIGPIQYAFHIRLSKEEMVEVMAAHPDFFQWCASKVAAAKYSPLSIDLSLQLGVRSAGG